jgi:hypothetical protein
MATRQRMMTLEAVEFIRRFLLHVLPSGFVRIRHFGFLANRVRKEKLALCRSLLTAQQPATQTSTDSPGNSDSKIEDHGPSRCPSGTFGRLIFVQVLGAETLLCSPLPILQDTS